MRADIFCRVVDNYGDIGVCWRLARRLAHGRGWRVRLWVDVLPAFAAIEPGVDPTLASQAIEGIDIVQWSGTAGHATVLAPGEVAIEAFACDPPASYVAGMAQAGTLWINLEYLSAEDWVESCHALPSRQPGGQSKYFFFPGFTPGTGGLLREPGLAAQRDAWQADPRHAAGLLQALGVPPASIQAWRAGARLITVFCYPHASTSALAQSLLGDARPSILLVPHGVAPDLAEGPHGSGRLQIVRIPFVPQQDFDRLLWSADLNLVRGEDSFVRGIWAGRPMVWQIYPQDDEAHRVKLAAWLDRYQPTVPARRLIEAWNRPLPDDPEPARGAAAEAVASALQTALAEPAWHAWQAAARAGSDRAMAHPDLADTLADFCEKKSQAIE